MKLKFYINKIKFYADRYAYQDDDEILEIGKKVHKRGYYNKKEFIALTTWKTPRSKPLCANNDDALIKEVTIIALKTKNEYLKINILQILKGVSMPTASVLLHFATNYNYPILDFRALWSLGVDVDAKYDFELWEAYTNYCRVLSKRAKVDMRILDRALWQYSKENQK